MTNQMPTAATKQTEQLSIGQVIYILSHKAQTVVPAIVVEELLVKKIDGNHVSWKVSIGPKDKNRIVDSTKIDGEIFTSLDEIRNVLSERFQTYVNNLALETEQRVENWYGRQAVTNQKVEITGGGNGKIDPESFINSIEGTSNNKPSSPMKPMPSPVLQAQDTNLNSLRQRWKDMASGEDEGLGLQGPSGEDQDDPNTTKQVVKMTGPDGKEMLVSVKVPVG